MAGILTSTTETVHFPGAGWDRAVRFLCIRLDNMGDVLMTTPALRAIKASRPESTLTLLASPAGARLAGLVPEIDDTIPFEAPWMKAGTPPADSHLDVELISRLRRENFDAAIIFTVFTQNPLPAAYLAYLADIPLRLAYCRENPYFLLSDWQRETDLDVAGGIRHEVRRQLDLVAAVGYQTADERLSLSVPADALETVQERLPGYGIDPERPWVLIHPGATASSRRYPPEGFAMAANLLHAQGFQVVISGTASERPLAEQVRRSMRAPAVCVAGDFTFEQFVALVSLAPVLVCNNSGPAHIAAATGTPVVDLYALTNPQHTPWQVPSRVLSHDVPCKNCFRSICPEGHHHCLRLVSPSEVAQAVLDLYALREAVYVPAT